MEYLWNRERGSIQCCCFFASANNTPAATSLVPMERYFFRVAPRFFDAHPSRPADPTRLIFRCVAAILSTTRVFLPLPPPPPFFVSFLLLVRLVSISALSILSVLNNILFLLLFFDKFSFLTAASRTVLLQSTARTRRHTERCWFVLFVWCRFLVAFFFFKLVGTWLWCDFDDGLGDECHPLVQMLLAAAAKTTASESGCCNGKISDIFCSCWSDSWRSNRFKSC